VTWALAGGGAWLLIAATTDADQPVPVAAGLLLGLVLGQATVVELIVGMAGAGLVAAVDPLDVAAAALSVLMAAAVIVAVAFSARRPPTKEPEASFDSFI
jgi:ABC-type dipeptide/oligopeptide/nickel transport system permease component